jgi:hypothetical protein
MPPVQKPVKPKRKTRLLKGETARRRLAIPMFMGQVA